MLHAPSGVQVKKLSMADIRRSDTIEVANIEDAQRAGVYRLLSHILSAPPQADGLALVAGLTGESDTALGDAVNATAAAARATSPDAEADAYQTLFIGLGRGLLVPFGSYYLTGFLNEKPLARLRQDMQLLGLERSEDFSEPEDHIASVLEIMGGLVDGSLVGVVDPEDQKRFFEMHVASWAGHFFRDLAGSEASAFYSATGKLGEAFIEVEVRAFSLS